MKYRTVENPEHVRLRRERRSVVQISEFPFEDLNGNVVFKDRRETFDRRTEGLEVTETTMSRAEFQEYFDKSQQSG
ncbi:MAG: hypothetical protein KJO81_07665 [Gammaproteobacteria bacterium]|nr:hypothetical protein [Gammaproteobacteria bacterium]